MSKSLPAIRTKSGLSRAAVARKLGLDDRRYRALQRRIARARWFGDEEPHVLNVGDLLQGVQGLFIGMKSPSKPRAATGQTLFLLLQPELVPDEIATLLATRSKVAGGGLAILIHHVGQDRHEGSSIYCTQVWHSGGRTPQSIQGEIPVSVDDFRAA